MQWSRDVEEKISDLLKINDPRKVAVFDADGTLWHDDLGESFFKYQIKENLSPGIKNIKDPWAQYRDLDKKDTAISSAWLAQINAGLTEEELKKQSSEFYSRHFKNKPTEPIKSLIAKLNAAEFEVWICTASPKWSIEPCLKELQIPPERLIGTEVEIAPEKVPGTLSGNVVLPVPYTSGKRFWLEKKLGGFRPQLVAGNSRGDLEMMGLATHLALAIIYLPHLEPVRESEQYLMVEATRRGWPIQIFE